MSAIDIVIPVYNAHDDLVRCLQALSASTNTAHRVILIDDASPDARIGELFEKLDNSENTRFLLLRNEHNLGFVGTANRGMRTGSGDVVLLNSDTIVTSGWLERLQRCAVSDVTIGTITPFSNNAEICSFPELCVANPVPEDPESISSALAAAAVPLYPEIPTAVGFCMYVRRELIDRIGVFDEVFGKGYGEENDFCTRAAEAGFRNVLCEDAYVVHVGARSFSDEKKALAKTNLGILLRKHPSYSQEVAQFIERDPLKPFRQMACSQLRIRSNDGKPGILHVLHSHEGGTGKYARDVAAITRGALRHYLLVATEDQWIVHELEDGVCVQTYRFRYEDDELWSRLLDGICSWLGISLCHVHHVSGCRFGLLEAFAGCLTPYGIGIHDFYFACPTINLLAGGETYCGATTDLSTCQSCLNRQPEYSQIDIAEWRRRHATLLRRAAFISAPSRAAADIFNRYFPNVQISVIANIHEGNFGGVGARHVRCFLLENDATPNVGIVGAIGPVKGSANLGKLVQRTRERRLPLRWVVVGYTDQQYDPYQSDDHILTVHGPYDRSDLEAIIDHYRIALVVFPSAGPETFCYTLSETWGTGRPVLVPPVGALGERVTATGAGWIMDDWHDMDAILDQVLHLTGPSGEQSLQEKSRRVPRVVAESDQDSAARLVQCYRESAAAPAGALPLPAKRIYSAAPRAGDWVRREPARGGQLRNLARRSLSWGARYRHTRLGRWLIYVLPARWHYRLRRLLLQG